MVTLNIISKVSVFRVQVDGSIILQHCDEEHGGGWE